MSLHLLDEDSTIQEMKKYLKSLKIVHSFQKKEDYLNRLKLFKSHYTFPWRKDQQDVIDMYFGENHNFYVINGIFGCGKTTLLMSLVVRSIIEEIYTLDDIMFISFNICIRDELKAKLRKYGFKGKVTVRTFDSIIFEICKNNDYPHMDLPNYDGKRRFVYDLCREDSPRTLKFQPKVIFIDEVQDLEKQTLRVFTKFFPEARIVFAGDVFQSIQREPRESLLWYLLHQYEEPICKFYMKETPRVPKKILSSLKETLTEYYPEFEEEIKEWRSSNEISADKVEWKRFYSYTQLFDVSKDFINTYGEKNVMILTFSSAITVRGAMGDLARVRRNLLGQGFNVNKNHKRIDEDKVFLSTSNSSKGLERDCVLVLLTFPLERAFSNFSDDLVMNLITVAMTRAKKKVLFYIPAYEDKYTQILAHFKTSPRPDKDKIREGKTMKEFTFSDYINMEICVTEMIRQGIISYDTRIEVKEMIKQFESDTLFKTPIPAKRPIMETEEEKAFVGIMIENLITSTWGGKWPQPHDIEALKNHPLYCHVFKRIAGNYKKYAGFIRSNTMDIPENHFHGIYLYSQLHVAIYNKIFINFGKEIIENMKRYWSCLRSQIISIRPDSDKINIQGNLRMPWITGVADTIFFKDYGKGQELNLWEIKASISPDWKDDALTQVFLYALMTGKSWSRLSLINPFRNERCYYHFNSKKVMTLRNKVYKDALTWNFNCFLAKNYNKRCKQIFPTENKLFMQIVHDELGPTQMSVVEFLSPTKMFVRENIYMKREFPEGAKLTRLQKLCKESEHEWVTVVDEPSKGYDVWDMDEKFKELVTEEINLRDFLKYERNEELKYQLDFSDALVILFCKMVVISLKFKIL